MLEEEIVGKSYDSNVMKRLLDYAKPHWKLLVISISFLVFITLLELLNPFLIKIAIDDHINGNIRPKIEMEVDAPYEGVLIAGNKYVKEEKIPSNELDNYENYPRMQINKEDGNHYLVEYGNEGVEGGLLLSDDLYSQFRQFDIEGLDRVAIVFFLVILFTFVLNYAQTYILNYTSQKIIFSIREDVYNHILKLSTSYFDNNPIGRLVTRVTNDTEALNEMYTSVLVTLFKDIFMIVGIFIVMLSMNLRLALLSFILVPIILVMSLIFRKHIRQLYRIGRVQIAKINSRLNEYITGMKIIQIFNKEKKAADKFDESNKEYLGTMLKQVQIFAIFRPSVETTRSLGIAALIYFGGGNVIQGAIEIGVLFAFIDYLQKFFRPILDLTEKYNILQSAMASGEKIFDILDEDIVVKDPLKAQEVKEIKGRIEFKNVWFAYVGEDWVLKDVSFVINPGETVAIVGATGAGKTSIINLITRFYDIQKGEILIDGVNIKNYKMDDLRKQIGVVLQDVFVFSGTIEDNIRLNNFDIDKETIKEISKYVNAHNFIQKLPKGYQEPVMERGSTLSSGQRQLLAFARTLVYNPSILILDEATSNIDTETELLIQDALSKIIKNRTTIAIAHRLSTIQHSDKIIVLKSGIIREMGTHQELLNLNGLYYDLYRLQYNED